MKSCHTRILMLAAALVAVPALAGVQAPQVGLASVEQLQKPLPLPYDAAASADAQVAAAKARARAGKKRLLVDLGGNWCADCRVLAGIMDIPVVRTFLARYYEVVTVDIGRMDKNQQIPARYGITRLEGVPAILIIDPRTNVLVNAGHVSALSDARHMTPQGLADWLAQWAGPA